MPRIKVTKAFKHVDAGNIHPTVYGEGEHDVSERCAHVAVENRWAVAVEAKKAEHPTGSQTGEAKQPASSHQGPRSTKGKPTK